jgi:hypothetical protein
MVRAWQAGEGPALAPPQRPALALPRRRRRAPRASKRADFVRTRSPRRRACRRPPAHAILPRAPSHPPGHPHAPSARPWRPHAAPIPPHPARAPPPRPRRFSALRPWLPTCAVNVSI